MQLSMMRTNRIQLFTSHRLRVAARRYRYVVGCVADINSRSLRMHHLQAEIFALHLAHHLPPLLAVHLVPLAPRCLVTDFLAWLLVFLGFCRCLAFHASLLGLNSTWPARAAKLIPSLHRGLGLDPYSGQARHHLSNRQYRSHALFRAEMLQRHC